MYCCDFSKNGPRIAGIQPRDLSFQTDRSTTEPTRRMVTVLANFFEEWFDRVSRICGIDFPSQSFHVKSCKSLKVVLGERESRNCHLVAKTCKSDLIQISK